MKAVFYEQFGGDLSVVELADPDVPPGGVVVKVRATGLCRSDWHGWMGHDGDIRLPHVPGHELAGEIVEVDSSVQKWKVGDRITVPFSMGCGTCEQCLAGDMQVCDNYYQPGFTGWGSFAEYVALPFADVNLVRLPDAMDYVSAASLGCRFVTSYRAVRHQVNLHPGQWLAVHGCGGVGLSAILIARSIGVRVIAVDVSGEALQLAIECGAEATVDASQQDVVEQIHAISNGGAHASIDALGHSETCRNSIACLRKRGRHTQVGLMAGAHSEPKIPFAQIIARELEIVGSHGMAANQYPPLIETVVNGQLQPNRLVSRMISLDDVPRELPRLGERPVAGVTVVKLD